MPQRIVPNINLLVKLAHGHAKVIHVATVNDDFNIGFMKKAYSGV